MYAHATTCPLRGVWVTVEAARPWDAGARRWVTGLLLGVLRPFRLLPLFADVGWDGSVAQAEI